MISDTPNIVILCRFGVSEKSHAMSTEQKIIGRKAELETLSNALTSNQSEFVAIYGRRRVGKTYLIDNAYRKQMIFQFSGTLNTPMAQQILNFNSQIKLISKNKNVIIKPTNWFEALEQLKTVLLAKKSKQKHVIFFDELPWLDTMHSGFLQALDYFWNSWASKQTNIVLVVCGSAAAWMINKIIFNKGGLHNRVTRQIRLLPFNLHEAELYLLHKKIKLNRYQLTQIYMCFGGVPHYLNEIKPNLSAAQNIENCCFMPNGLLNNEFEKLFMSLFENSAIHKKIIMVLASRYSGFTRNDIITKAKLISGGYVSDVLDELIQSGFVDYTTPPNKTAKNSVYRLCDEYSLFYLKFIKNNHHPSKTAWTNITKSNAYTAWTGFAFETICLKHSQQIKAALGIENLASHQSQWLFKNSATLRLAGLAPLHNGAQIDLLIDRADGCINVCEIKFTKEEFEITKKYAENLEKKLSVFVKETKSKKSLFLTFISNYGVKQNTYATNLVVNNVLLDDLYKF